MGFGAAMLWWDGRARPRTLTPVRARRIDRADAAVGPSDDVKALGCPKIAVRPHRVWRSRARSALSREPVTTRQTKRERLAHRRRKGVVRRGTSRCLHRAARNAGGESERGIALFLVEKAAQGLAGRDIRRKTARAPRSDVEASPATLTPRWPCTRRGVVSACRNV